MKALRPVGRWRSLLSDPSGTVRRRLHEIYGPDEVEIQRRLGLWTAALDGFAQSYSPDAEVLISRACGRVNLLGMHIDHRGGAVNALGVGDVIFVAQPRDDDAVVLCNASADFPTSRFSISKQLPPDGIDDWDHWTMQQYRLRLAEGTQADWSNYVRAALVYLQHINTAPDGTFRPPLRGMNVFVAGDVPTCSGLSSSSSLVVAAMEACIAINELAISQMDMVEAARVGEWYVGTRGGGGDHAAIKFSRYGHLAHLGAFPLTVELIPFPEEFCVVLCDSMVVAAKTAAARDIFNQRVACYELGMLILRKSFPQYAAKMKLLRDVNPSCLDVDEGAIYEMLKGLPESVTRQQVSQILPEAADQLDRIFRTHEPVEGGYHIRQACLYGIAECLRSQRGAELLGAGDVEGFGELITLSHEGDRMTHLLDGRRVPLQKTLGDGQLDKLAADVRSSDPKRRDSARLYRQPGGYDVSCQELDELVDIACAAPGVLGAGLVGAGLGGSIVVLTRRDAAAGIIAAVEEHYYNPRSLPLGAQLCGGVGGSGVLDAGG